MLPEQADIIRALEWGQQSEQQLLFPYVAAGAMASFALVPQSPFSALIVHQVRFATALPNAFILELSQPYGISRHQLVLNGDFEGLNFWAYVTNSNPLNIKVGNRTAFDGFLSLTLDTVNLSTLSDLKKIKGVFSKMYGLELRMT